VARAVSRGKLTEPAAHELVGRVAYTSELSDLDGVDAVVEAVTEDPRLKGKLRMYEEGFASREDIDEGMRLGCGHPMGPLTLCDFIGLDVLYAVCETLYDEFKRPEYAPPPLLKRMVVSGHHGRKAGQGFYTYP
jgi:3-hydroxyacyl-CoA dehydrogenase